MYVKKASKVTKSPSTKHNAFLEDGMDSTSRNPSTYHYPNEALQSEFGQSYNKTSYIMKNDENFTKTETHSQVTGNTIQKPKH